MKFWPWSKTENRASTYTDAVLAHILARAGGTVSAGVGATAALEAAAGFVSRAFSCAEVKGEHSGALDPLTMGMIGRCLIRTGEFVALIQVGEGGMLRLSPASGYDITGADDPETWLYRLDLAGPNQHRTVTGVPNAGIVHVKYSTDPEAPWRGIGPIQIAQLAGRLSAETSNALADEMSGPRGHLLPQPNVDGADPTVAALKNDIKELRGSVALVQSQDDNYGTDPSQPKKGGGWGVQRLGADLPASSVQVATLAFDEVIAACGLPPGLFDKTAEGTSQRESYRRAVHSQIEPCGKIVAAELSKRLERPISFDFTAMRSVDIAGRARSFAALMKGGMDISEAAVLSGLRI